MAEVLGAVAAAAQLTATCLALIELTKRLKGRASAMKEYQDQLSQLHLLSNNISNNPLLQTPEIELHTRNIISLLSHHTLEDTLSKSRASQFVLFFTQERSIARLFIDLERHKATLSLVINNIQSRALHQIQNNLNNMSGQDAYTSNIGVNNTPAADEGSRVPLAQPPTITRSAGFNVPFSSEVLAQNMDAGIVFPRSNTEVGPYTGATVKQPTNTSDEPQATQSPSTKQRIADAEGWLDLWLRKSKSPNMPSAMWLGNYTSGNAETFNGTMIEGDFDMLPRAAVDRSGEPEIFAGTTVDDGGFQHNGIVRQVSPDTTQQTLDPIQRHFLGTQTLGSNDPRRITRQINGNIVRARAVQPSEK